MIKVLVTGGRDYKHQQIVNDALDSLHREHQIIMVIHGDCSGADYMADQWAAKNCVQQVRCPANWKRLGSNAGPRRNALMMMLKPDLVLAFPGGSGTTNCISNARALGIEVLDVSKPFSQRTPNQP